MARKIDQDLQAIREAVYGEEVRGAIVDGIEQAYLDANDVVKVSETQPTAENVKLWVKPESEEFKVPTWEEHQEVSTAISGLKSALVNTQDLSVTKPTNNFEWESGAVDGTGTDIVYPARCRMVDKVPCEYYKAVKASENLELIVNVYDNTHFLGYYNGATITTNGIWLVYADLTNDILDGCFFRLTLRLKETPTATIDPAIGNTDVSFISVVMARAEAGTDALDYFVALDENNNTNGEYPVDIKKGVEITYSITNNGSGNGYFTVQMLDSGKHVVNQNTFLVNGNGGVYSGVFVLANDCSYVRITNSNSKYANIRVAYDKDVIGKVFQNEQDIADNQENIGIVAALAEKTSSYFELLSIQNTTSADYTVSIPKGTSIEYTISNLSSGDGFYSLILYNVNNGVIARKDGQLIAAGASYTGTFNLNADCVKLAVTNSNSKQAKIAFMLSDSSLKDIGWYKYKADYAYLSLAGKTVMVDGATDAENTNYYVYEQIPAGCSIEVISDSTSKGFNLYGVSGSAHTSIIQWVAPGKRYIVTAPQTFDYLRCFAGANATVKFTLIISGGFVKSLFGSKVKIVGADYGFATIQEAVDVASDGDTILIMPGTYREQVSAWAKELHFVGLDKDNCVLIDSKADYNAPPLEISHGSLQNMTIIEDAMDTEDTDPENVNTAYCVHIEHPAGAGHTLLIDNCIMRNANRPCLGIGLQQDFTLTIRNCDFYSGVHVAGPAARGAVYFHTKNAENYTGQNIRLQNNKIVCADTVAMTIMPLQSGQGSAEFINNMIYSEINGKQNTAIWNGSNQNCFDTNFVLSPTSYGNNVALVNAE